MGQNIVRAFYKLLSPYLPYVTILQIKDFITWFSGVFTSMVIVFVWLSMSWVRNDIEWREFATPGLLLVQFKKDDGKRKVFIKSPKSFLEAYNLLLALLLSHCRVKKKVDKIEISYGDLRRFRIASCFFLGIGIFCSFIAIIFICCPYLEPLQ